jgi:hypothetical protein
MSFISVYSKSGSLPSILALIVMLVVGVIAAYHTTIGDRLFQAIVPNNPSSSSLSNHLEEPCFYDSEPRYTNIQIGEEMHRVLLQPCKGVENSFPCPSHGVCRDGTLVGCSCSSAPVNPTDDLPWTMAMTVVKLLWSFINVYPGISLILLTVVTVIRKARSLQASRDVLVREMATVRKKASGGKRAAAADADASRQEAEEDADSFAEARSLVAGRRLPARDMEQDENQDPETNEKPNMEVGLTIVVDRGPEKGTAVNLIRGQCEHLIIGRNPVAENGEATLALTRDGDTDDSHIEIELSSDKKLKSVVVTDLKSSSGTFVDNDRIKIPYKIFRGQRVRIGNSTLLVKDLDGGKVATAPRQQGKTTRKSYRALLATVSTKTVAAPMRYISLHRQPTLKRRGVRICVIEGPHKGDDFELEFGVSESTNIGSKPTAGKSRTNISLQKDKTLKSNHVHIELIDDKKLQVVMVTDKSQGDLKINRDTVKKSRAFINDQIQIGKSVLQIKSL